MHALTGGEHLPESDLAEALEILSDVRMKASSSDSKRDGHRDPPDGSGN